LNPELLKKLTSGDGKMNETLKRIKKKPIWKPDELKLNK